MSNASIGITLLGCGTVGGGVVNVLMKQREVIRRRTGLDLALRHVVVKSEAEYPPNAKELPMSLDANAAIDDPTTQIVVELIGGTGVAAAFVERALKLGKPVVTANKALLATKGPELFKLARENNTCIAFEASAGGGIPIIDALQRGLIANRVDALVGIVNGTCNFILSQMTQKGWSYDQALEGKQAQVSPRRIRQWMSPGGIRRRSWRFSLRWRSPCGWMKRKYISKASTRWMRPTLSSRASLVM